MPKFYDIETPEISVIILNYNKPDLTRTCLEYLWANTAEYHYEIIVVDNGSTPENVEPLRDIAGPFRLIRLDVNRYFGEGNNIGAEAARGSYLLFLNNDAFVTPGWLQPLMRRLNDEPLLGGVGPRFLYPDGRVQEAGSFVSPEGIAVQVGKFGAYATADLEEDHVVDYCSAACFLMRRNLFLEVGGFEYTYEPAYYEDVDLCLKIAARGLFVGYCSRSHVVHVENATSATHREALGFGNIIEVNRRQFLHNWGDWLAQRERKALHREIALPFPISLQHVRPRAIFYTPFEITPGGGERYLLTAAAALMRDFDVYLVTEETYSRTRTRAIGRDLNLDLAGLRLARRQSIGDLGPIAFGVTMSNEALPPFPPFARHSLYLCQFPFPQGWDEVVRRTGNLDDFNGTVVYSDFVRHHLIRARDVLGMSDHPVTVVAPPVPLAALNMPLMPLGPTFRFVLVGRFFSGGHNKRHDVAIELIRDLSTRGLPVELDIVGSLSPLGRHRQHYTELRKLAEGLPITFHVNAAQEVLRDVLTRGHFYIHAAGYEVNEYERPQECEHFGISVLEAMSHGLIPFVVANGGPASFVRNGTTGYTYRTLGDLVERVLHAIETPEDLASIRANAIAAAETYAEANFVAQWRDLATNALSGSK